MDDNNNYKDKLNYLCKTVREYIEQKKHCECEKLITNAMMLYPHAPEPHNLMGILLEDKGDHLAAMKHFRASCALDPSYLPTRYNMSQYGDFFCIKHKNAFDETDCPQIEERNPYKVEYDEYGIGHIVRKCYKTNKI